MSPFINIITDLIKMALVALLTKLGFDVAAHTGDIQSAAGTIAGFLTTAAVAASLVIWKWLQHTKLWNQISDAPASLPSPSNATSAATKALLVILCLLPLTLASCGMLATPTPATPQDAEIAKIDQAMEAYLVLTAPVDAAIAAGEIKGTAADAITVIEARIAAHFAAARTAAQTGSPPDADAQLQLFAGDRAALIEAIAAAHPATTTNP